MIEIWTDGSSDQRTYASYGFVAVRDDQILHQQNGPLPKPFTNSNAEIYALYYAIEYYIENHSSEEVVFKSDSMYCINTLNENWGIRSASQWKKLKYAQEFQRMLFLKKQYNLKFEHVPAHCGLKYNELADRLAREAITLTKLQ